MSEKQVSLENINSMRNGIFSYYRPKADAPKLLTQISTSNSWHGVNRFCTSYDDVGHLQKRDYVLRLGMHLACLSCKCI